MGVLENGMGVLTGALESVSNVIEENKAVAIGSGVAVAGLVGGTIIGTTIAKTKKKRKKSKTKKSKKRSKSKYNHKRKRKHNKHGTRRRRRGRRTPRTAGKGKDTSRRRIRYTKKGQPYVIMASGKARFIKKSGAKRSHKRKGGRY